MTGRANYGEQGLLENPHAANDSKIAARVLASFLKSREIPIKEALLEGNLRMARKLVNGGSHGITAFIDAYQTGLRLIPDELAA